MKTNKQINEGADAYIELIKVDGVSDTMWEVIRNAYITGHYDADIYYGAKKP